MSDFLKRHKVAVFLAVLTGFIFSFPQFHYRLSLGDDYQGIYRVINDDEPYYMTRAQDIVDGHYFLSNSLLYEHKNGMSMQFFLPDLILAMPAKILGIGVYPLYHFYDFLLPLIGIFLTYFVFLKITENKNLSLLGSSSMYLVHYVFLFNRPISPQFNFLFVLTLTLILLKIFKDGEHGRKWWILAGMNYGVIFYIYTYFWTYMSTVIFLLLLYFLIKKKKIEAVTTAKIFFLGIGIGLPYFYQTYMATKLPVFEESVRRLGMLDTRVPSGIQIIIPAGIMLLLYAWRYRRKIKDISFLPAFMIIGLLADVINVNHHIITGKNLYFSSHYELVSYFFIAFALAYFIAGRMRDILKKREVVILLYVFVCSLIVRNYLPILKYDLEKGIKRQNYEALFSWLNENTKKDDVVFSYDGISGSVASYTHNNVFYDTDALLFFMSDEEVLERFILNNFWREDFNVEFIRENFSAIFGFKYNAVAGKEQQKNKIRKLFNNQEVELEELYYPPDEIERVLTLYQEYKEKNWIEELNQYKVDYFIAEKESELDDFFKQQEFLRLKQKIGLFHIYEKVRD